MSSRRFTSDRMIGQIVTKIVTSTYLVSILDFKSEFESRLALPPHAPNLREVNNTERSKIKSHFVSK